jgi:hypothetical protein
LASGAEAAIIYSDEASFLTHVQPGYYLETFDTLPTGYLGVTSSFAGNGYAYTASADNGLWGNPVGYLSAKSLSTNLPPEPIHFSFTGNPVTAVGGYFTSTDFSGSPVDGTVTVGLSDGTQLSASVPSAWAFVGFVANQPISWLEVLSGKEGSRLDGRWPAADDVYVGAAVGAAVPEPCTLAIWSLLGGIGAIVGYRRRKAALAA